MNERLKKLLERMKALTDKATAEKRDLTDEESAEFDGYKKEFDSLERTLNANDVTQRVQGVIANLEKPVNTPIRAELGLTDKELKRYSLSRALLSTMPGSRIDAGYERELSQEVEKQYGRSANGIYIPHDVLTSKRDMNTGVATAGGNLVATNYMPGSFIELLRARALMMQLGVQTLDGLVGNVAISKQTGASTAYWVTEGVGTTQSELTIGMINMSPKTITAKTATTRQLLMQSNPSVDALLMNDLSKVLGLGIDKAIISGSGASGQPRGILNTSGIGSVSCATAAGGFNFANAVKFETALETANYDSSTCNYVMTPSIKGTAKSTPKVAGAAAMIFEDNEVNGYGAYSTMQMNANTVLFGDFSEIILGLWGGLDLMLDPYAKADSGGLVVRAFQSADIAIRHAAAFAASNDVGL
ncbi:MAG: phage major capsid protein [Clostridia bacterium]|nr:phage major capsid protein [Clostridia bacterium]